MNIKNVMMMAAMMPAFALAETISISPLHHEFRPLCAYSRKPVRAAVQMLSIYISQHA